MYFRNISPSTTCLYSAASMLPRRASATRQSSARWSATVSTPEEYFNLEVSLSRFPEAIFSPSVATLISPLISGKGMLHLQCIALN